MAFSLGSIEASLRIRIADFMQGLRQAQAEAVRASTRLAKDLTVKPRLDATAAEHAWQGLLGRFRGDSQAFGEHAKRAGEEGARGLAGLNREVLNTAKSFALAQLGVGSLGQALEGVKRFYAGVIEANAEAETNALHYAEALLRSGQAGKRALQELIDEWAQVENASEDAARQAGVRTSQLQFFVIKAVGAGVSKDNAVELVKALSIALRNATGPTERLGAAFQTMMALIRGDVEQADLLIRQLGAGGRDAVVEMSQALSQGDVPKAIARLNERLGLTVELNERHAASWRGVTTAAANAWEEVRKGASAKRLMAELETAVGGVTTDLQKGGVLWHLTRGAIATANDAARLFNHTLEAANDWLKSIHAGPLGDILSRMQDINQAAFSWMKAHLPEWALSSNILTPPKPPGETPTPTPGAGAGTPVKTGPTIPTAEGIRLQETALKTLTLEQQKQLDLTQQRGRVSVAAAEATGSEAQIAQARTAAEQAVLGLRRQQIGVLLQQKSALLGQVVALKGATDEQAIGLAQEIQSLEAERASLGVQSQAVGLEGQRAAALARVTQLENSIRDVGQVSQAQAERTLATLRSQFAGEVDLLKARQAQQEAALDTEEHGLRLRQSELEKAGQLSQAERERLSRALEVVAAKRETLELDTRTGIQVAQITRQLAEMAAMGRLQDTIVQGQLAAWEAQGEQDQIHLRMLGLTAEHEQMISTQLAAANKERTTGLELERVRQRSQELAADFATRLQTTAKDQVAEVTVEYARQQTELSQQGRQLERNLQTLQLLTKEAVQSRDLTRAKEFADSLVNAVKDFQSALSEGSLDLARFVRGIGQSFIEYAMKPLMDQMKESLTSLMKSLSGSLGSWGNLITAGIGAALVGVSTLFKHQKAEVEALGKTAKDQIQQTERVRGLVAGDTTIAVQRISEDLGRALRPTNTLIAEGNRILATIATALGQQTTANNTAGYGGYSISSEVLGAARTG